MRLSGTALKALNHGLITLNGGVLVGNGTVTTDRFTNSGIVQPGSPVGTLRVEGGYTQTPTGTLQLDLAGKTPVLEHDLLTVMGDAILGGAIQVVRPNGYRPAAGDNYRVATFPSHTGAFVREDGFALGGGMTLETTYAPDSLILNAVQANVPLYGDLNGDGKITVADATRALRLAVGLEIPSPAEVEAGDVAPQPGTGPKAGQPYGDGRITVADAIRLLRQTVGMETNWP